MRTWFVRDTDRVVRTRDILYMLQEGSTFTEIAAHYGVATSTVTRAFHADGYYMEEERRVFRIGADALS